MIIALAEALLRRKELQEKVKQADQFRREDFFDVKVKRVSVTDSVDDLTMRVPKLDLKQVTAEYDFYSRQLRKIDAIIQRANWETQVEADHLMNDYTGNTVKEAET